MPAEKLPHYVPLPANEVDGEQSEMEMIYESPDGSLRIVEPTEQVLADIVLLSDASYWQQGGSGQALLSIGGQPCLSIMQPGPGQFFMELFLRDRLVPYDGGSCEAFVVTEMGGDPFRVPLACTVTPKVAASALAEFVQTRREPTGIRWVPMGDVPFQAGWYDE